MVQREKKRSELILPQSQSGRQAAPLSSAACFDASTKSDVSRPKLPEGYPHYYYSRRATAAQEYRQRKENPVSVDIHADMLKVRFPDSAKGIDAGGGPAAGGGIRGKVTGFSRASRKRMIEFMASVRNTGSMMFLTMTFDDTTALNSDDWMLAQFEAFRRRFERAYPHWRALWRKEHQDRKSGALLGTFVPHYHMIIFTGVHYEKIDHEALTERFRKWGAEAWHQITSSTDEANLVYGFDVTPVRSRKHAYAYVAKYIGKVDRAGIHAGRSWGRIGTFDCSSSQTIFLAEDEYIVFRRLVKRWLKTRAVVPAEDATPEEVEKWLIRMKRDRKYAKSFARQSCAAGCTVFGLGDTGTSEEILYERAGFLQFISECKRQAQYDFSQGSWLPG